MLFLFLKLECCGSSNYTDWQASEWKKSNPTKEVPLSCCKEGKDTSTCNAEAGFNLDNINTKVIIWYSYSHAVTRAYTRSRTIPATYLEHMHTHSRAGLLTLTRTHSLRKGVRIGLR